MCLRKVTLRLHVTIAPFFTRRLESSPAPAKAHEYRTILGARSRSVASRLGCLSCGWVEGMAEEGGGFFAGVEGDDPVLVRLRKRVALPAVSLVQVVPLHESRFGIVHPAA